LFIPTASGDSPEYLLTFYRQLAGVDCEPTHLELYLRTVDDIGALVASQDVVMVGGGNTANMLAICGSTASIACCATHTRRGPSSRGGRRGVSAGSRAA
jgi:peptidase E